MTLTQLIAFILIFITPSAYQRIHFYYKRNHFEKISNIRDKSGLQIHHGHWGLLWIFISSIYFIFGDKNIYIIFLAAFGWGLLMDEIIPALKTPSTDREAELQIYSKSTKPTMILLGVVILGFILIYFLLK